MDFLKYMAVATVVIPLTCSAEFQINLNQFTCSGAQKTESIVDLQIDCDGDLHLKGGTLSANTDIKISASGVLTLEDVTIDTPGKFYQTAPSLMLLGTVNIPSSSAAGSSPAPPSGSTLALRNQIPDRPQNADGTLTTSDGSLVITVPGGSSQTPPCAQSTFRIIKSTSLYCPSGKSGHRELGYLRANGECSGKPTGFQISSSLDFPDNGTTATAHANCSNTGKGKTSCLLHHAATSTTVTTMPPVYAGSLMLSRRSNGQITGLTGHALQQTADGCHSEIRLKSLSRM